ncbi:hypothetical protein DPMN_051363 [Dreissena polymorpha]|uniref:Uncharacterized protein n=1 Tax=Dreissena polymorpha TaxID=45954 RepID=A0A9D4CIZ8_DREPO|nr:hypothetical protein DPMN_051363 [Dreissena polymorpha]
MLGSDLYLQESDEMCTSTFSIIKDFFYIPSHNISRNQLEVSCIRSSYDTIKEKILQGRARWIFKCCMDYSLKIRNNKYFPPYG